MKKYSLKLCFTLMLTFGIIVFGLAASLVLGQTVAAYDSEFFASYEELTPDSLTFGNTEKDEVFKTDLHALDDLVNIGGFYYFDNEHYHFRDRSPIEFDIEITRYYGPVHPDGALVHPDNIEGDSVQLTLRAIDVDSDYVNPGHEILPSGKLKQPEQNEVFINGHYIGDMSGSNNAWSLSSFHVPVEYLKFPALDESGHVIPAVNKVSIDIDMANLEDRPVWAVVVDWGALTIKGIRPVVLIHGFLSSEETWIEWTKAQGYAESYGLPVHTFSFAHNSQDWRINASEVGRQIAIAKERFGVEKLNVVGHSKGGLDTRAYLQQAKETDIQNLIMLGSPNGGSPLADAASMMKWKIFLTYAIVNGIAEPALTQLTTEHMSSIFNEMNKENPNVSYYTLAGKCCDNSFLMPGLSDKIVQVDSVELLPYTHELGRTDDTHFSLTKNSEVFDIVMSTLKSGDESILGQSFGLFGSQETGTYQYGDSGAGEVALGQQMMHDFRLQAGVASQLLIMADHPVSVAIISPSNERIETDDAENGIAFHPYNNEALFAHAAIDFLNAEPGLWQLEVSPASAAAEVTHYGWIIADDGYPMLISDLTPRIAAANEPIIMEATVEGLDDLEDLVVQASIRLPDGTLLETPLQLEDQGDGKYRGEYVPENSPGSYMVLITAENNMMMRQQLSAFTLLSSVDRLPESYEASGVYTDNDELYDWLEVKVPLQIHTAGEYLVSADLYDQHNQFIASATAQRELTADDSTLVLQFPGPELAASRYSGELILKDVQLHHLTHSLLSDWTAGNAAIFSDFTWDNFQRSKLSVLPGITDEAIEPDSEGKYRKLKVTVPVHVLDPQHNDFSANASLVAYDGTELDRAWVEGIQLGEGDAEGDGLLTLIFDGERIGAHGLNGPFYIRDLTFGAAYPLDDAPYYLAVMNLYETQPYLASHFVGNGQPHSISLAETPDTIQAGDRVSISGKVLDAEGRGISGMEIEISFSDGTPSMNTVTKTGFQHEDDKGTFSVELNSLISTGEKQLTVAVHGEQISETISIEVRPANPTKLRFDPELADSLADSTVGQRLPPVQIYLVDQYDNPTKHSGASVTLSLLEDSTVLYGTTTVTSSDGVVIFDDLLVISPGTYTFAAEARVSLRFLEGESEPFYVASSSNAEKVQNLTLQLNVNQVEAGHDLFLHGRVIDAEGHGVSGVIVEFTSDDPVKINPVATDINGDYEASFAPEQAGNAMLTAIVQDTDISETTSYEVTHSSVDNVIITDQPNHTLLGNPINKVQARLVDQYGNFVYSEEDINISLSYQSNSNASLTGTTTVRTNSEGIAAFHDLSINHIGRYRLWARYSPSNLGSAYSEDFAVIPDAQLQLTLEVDPDIVGADPVEAGERVTFSGKVTDVGDQVISGLPIEFSSNLGSAPAGVLTNQEGEYTTPLFRLEAAGDIELTAAIPGTDVKETINYTVTPSLPSKLEFIKQPEDGQVNQNIPSVQVRTLDLYNNFVHEEYEMTAYFYEDGFNVQEGETVTTIDGVATFANLSINTPGTYTIMAITVVNDTPRFMISEPFTIAAASAPVPAHVTLTGPSTVQAGDEVIVSGTVLDTKNNGLEGMTVTFSLDQGSAPIQAVTKANGTYTASFTPTTAEALQLTATVQGTGLSNTISIEVTPATASKLVFVIQPEDTATGQTMNAVQLRLFDSYDNPATDELDITVSINGDSSVKLIGTTTVIALEGVAIFSDLSIDKAGIYTLTAEASGLMVSESELFTIEESSSGEEKPFADMLAIIQPSEFVLLGSNWSISGEVAAHSTVTGSVYSEQNIAIIPSFLIEVTHTDDELSSWSAEINHSLAPGTYQLRIHAERTVDGLSEFAIKTHDFTIPQLSLIKVEVYDLAHDQAVLTFNQPVSAALTTDHFAGLQIDARNITSVISVQGASVTVRLDGQIGYSDPLTVTYVVGSVNPYAADNPLNYLLAITENEQSGIEKDNGIAPSVPVNPGTTPPAPAPAAPAPSTPEKEIIEVDIIAGDGSPVTAIPIERTIHPNGTLTDQVTITAEVAKTAVDKATSADEKMIRIVISDGNEEVSEDSEVSEVNVDVPLASVQLLAENGIDLELYTENSIIRLSSATLAGINEDFYFRLIPVNDPTEQDDIAARANLEAVVRTAAGEEPVNVVGRPITIETNLSGHHVTLVLPLLDAELPEQAAERAAFLAQLGIFIEHSDGEKVLAEGAVIDYHDGLLGLEFTISKFSIFTIVQLNNAQIGVHEAYIYGFSDGEFKPFEHVTRAQIAVMMARNLRYDISTTADDSSFKDVATDHFAAAAIAYVHSHGIMNGYPDDLFRAERPVTRAEMAVIAANYLNLSTMSTEEEQQSFHDTSGHWAHALIKASLAAAIVEGYSDGSYKPEQNVTRAEAVVILNRIFKRGPLYGDYMPVFPDVQPSHWAYEHIQEAAIDHAYQIDMQRREYWISPLLNK